MTIKTVFKSSMANTTFVFANGKCAHFMDHRFFTDILWEIEELTKEIKDFQNPYLSIPIEEGEKTIDTDADPLAAIKAQGVAEFLAAQATAVDPSRDMGTTDNGATVMANTNFGTTTNALTPEELVAKSIAPADPVKTVIIPGKV